MTTVYQIRAADPNDLEQIKIKNQDEIVERTGLPLDLLKAYELIKKETNDFTKNHEDALLADQLMVQLLQESGIVLPEIEPEVETKEETPPSKKKRSKSKPASVPAPENSESKEALSNKSKMELEIIAVERERTRALELLELELSL